MADFLQVILVGHVPPGFTTPRALRWMTKAFNERFVELVLKHARTIAALHFGHEHHDSFRLFYDDSSTIMLCILYYRTVKMLLIEHISGCGITRINYNDLNGECNL